RRLVGEVADLLLGRREYADAETLVGDHQTLGAAVAADDHLERAAPRRDPDVHVDARQGSPQRPGQPQLAVGVPDDHGQPPRAASSAREATPARASMLAGMPAEARSRS